MTDLDVLRDAINELDSISVPIKYTDTISFHILSASTKLKQLYNVIVKKLKEEEEAQKDETVEQSV